MPSPPGSAGTTALVVLARFVHLIGGRPELSKAHRALSHEPTPTPSLPLPHG